MKKEKIVKASLIIGVIIFGVLTLKLVVKYSLNEVTISRYEQGEYEEGWIQPNLFLNMLEGYVVQYNLGDIYYRQGKYAKAVEAFKNALAIAPKEKECSVRGNLALARLLEIDVANEKAERLVGKLQDIAGILLVADCARTDGRGVDARDQTIYDGIQTILKGTEEGEEAESEETNEEKQEKEGDTTKSDTEKEIRKQMEAASQGANNQYDYSDFEVYEGKVW